MTQLKELKVLLDENQLVGRELEVSEQDGFLIVKDSVLGDFPVYAAISGDVLEMWVDLVPKADIDESKEAQLNEILLVSNKLTGLSTFSIGDGYYQLVGKLSASSKIESILQDLDALLDMTEDSLQLFLDFLKK